MVKKIIGYILTAIGLVGLASASIPNLNEALKVPTTISNSSLTIGSLAVIIIGILFIILDGKSLRAGEVPIYKGKEIVGYRRK